MDYQFFLGIVYRKCAAHMTPTRDWQLLPTGFQADAILGGATARLDLSKCANPVLVLDIATGQVGFYIPRPPLPISIGVKKLIPIPARDGSQVILPRPVPALIILEPLFLFLFF